MDILKKMFESNKSGGGGGGGGGQPGDNNNCHPKMPKFGDEFRKPVWFDDCESDDELYGGNSSQQKVFAGFQVFTNPLEMQRHFEQQVDEMMRSLHQFEGDDTDALFNDNARHNYLKPGFEELFGTAADDADAENDAASSAAAGSPYKAPPPALDSDLDGEIYADQLHSLLQRISPDLEALLPRKSAAALKQSTATAPLRGRSSAMATTTMPDGTGRAAPLSDEQQVWNLIHGTADQPPAPSPRRHRSSSSIRKPAVVHPPARSGIFEGAFQGPKIFRQSVMTQTVRRPDGTTETRRVVRDADGNTNTTVTKTTADGRSETTSSSSNNNNNNNGGGGGFEAKPPPGGLPPNGGATVMGQAGQAASDRNIYVTKEGYAMPMNIW